MLPWGPPALPTSTAQPVDRPPSPRPYAREPFEVAQKSYGQPTLNVTRMQVPSTDPRAARLGEARPGRGCFDWPAPAPAAGGCEGDTGTQAPAPPAGCRVKNGTLARPAELPGSRSGGRGPRGVAPETGHSTLSRAASLRGPEAERSAPGTARWQRTASLSSSQPFGRPQACSPSPLRPLGGPREFGRRAPGGEPLRAHRTAAEWADGPRLLVS